MGEIIKNSEIFKNLGFDSSNQWIFYDDRFQKFFDQFSNNISDENVLSENEVLGKEDLVRRKELVSGDDLQEKLECINEEHPGLLSATEAEVSTLLREIEILEQSEEAFASLVVDMVQTKNKTNQRLNSLEDSLNSLENEERELLKECQLKAKQLEDKQSENCKLINESRKCFTRIHSPPLFMHQLPLEQYFLKCDSFLQYFTLYVKENYKVQDFIDLNESENRDQEISLKLSSLEKSIYHYTLEYIKEKSRSRATQYLIDRLDLSKIHAVSLADMQRETHDLNLLNTHHLNDARDALLNDLELHVHERTKQCLEMMIYENTKQKYQRALSRHEEGRDLSKIISDALLNAELIWVAIQFDLEKSRDRLVVDDKLVNDAHSCLLRMKTMRQLADKNTSLCPMVIETMAEDLSKHLNQRVPAGETKAFLYEYEKFGRLLAYALQNLLNKKCYGSVLELLKEVDRLEDVLKPVVYDSPVRAPMFEPVDISQPIFNAKMQQHHIEKTLRNLRAMFHENVRDKMEKDKLWRNAQLLWIWFLTDPQRVLMAIEEVKKAAMTGVKAVAGIKRI